MASVAMILGLVEALRFETVWRHWTYYGPREVCLMRHKRTELVCYAGLFEAIGGISVAETNKLLWARYGDDWAKLHELILVIQQRATGGQPPSCC
jgi:hypothetical protein